jgi:hypothetical protein
MPQLVSQLLRDLFHRATLRTIEYANFFHKGVCSMVRFKIK